MFGSSSPWPIYEMAGPICGLPFLFIKPLLHQGVHLVFFHLANLLLVIPFFLINASLHSPFSWNNIPYPPYSPFFKGRKWSMNAIHRPSLHWHLTWPAPLLSPKSSWILLQISLASPPLECPTSSQRVCFFYWFSFPKNTNTAFVDCRRQHTLGFPSLSATVILHLHLPHPNYLHRSPLLNI